MPRTYCPFGYWPLRYLPGWYWPNISHGHRVYRGPGGLANVDFATPVGFAQAGAAEVTLAGLGHAANARYTYALRPVCGNAWLETDDYSCVREMQTDADGEWLGSRPAPVEWLAAVVESAGRVTLQWQWRRPYGGLEPEEFALRRSASPRMADPVEVTAAYSGEGGYSRTFTLDEGRSYYFAICARAASGIESHRSKVIGPYTADATPPARPIAYVSTRF